MSDSQYTLIFSQRAQKAILRLDNSTRARILEKLDEFVANATKRPHIALKGKFAGKFKLRIGDNRIVYNLNHEQKLLIVELIGHRSDVYDE